MDIVKVNAHAVRLTSEEHGASFIVPACNIALDQRDHPWSAYFECATRGGENVLYRACALRANEPVWDIEITDHLGTYEHVVEDLFLYLWVRERDLLPTPAQQWQKHYAA